MAKKWNRDAVYQALKFASKRRDEWADGVDGDLSFPTESHSDIVAAAPDLLDALQNFIDSVTFIDPSVYPQSLEQARAAIAKAKKGGGVMSDELNRLRADLEVLERYNGYSIMENALCDIRDKVAKLEAAADPWREAKEFCNDYRGDKERFGIVTAYIDHLTAENADLKHKYDLANSTIRIATERLAEEKAENERLTKRVKELEAENAPIDPDGYQLGDFRVMKTAQEIARYAMDRNIDHPVIVKTARRAIWAIKEFVEQARHWHGLSKLKPYRWTSLGRDDTKFIDEDFDATESPCDYDPDSHKPLADMQPPFEGPIVGIEPVLDPARVLATAAVRLDEMHISGGAYLRNYTDGAKPYRMCERSVSIAFVDDLEVEPKRAIATAKNIVDAAGWLKTANDLKRFLAEKGGSGSIPYRTKGETNELA